MKALFFANRKLLISVATAFLLASVALACGSAAEPVAEESQPHPTEGEGTAASDSAVTVASTAPLFTLPSATGDTFDLASFAGDKNVVLVFYRGFW